MSKIRRTFPRSRIKPKDMPGIMRGYLFEESFTTKIRPGMRIAITAGPRGIANVALVAKTVADYIRSRGAEPFVVLTMGSHGGATAEGQKDVLESYGITESYLGCPILPSMEVKEIGVNEEDMDVLIDKYTAGADGIIVSRRIKPYTAFKGPYESGIMKMMATGLGKQHRVKVRHEAGFKNMAKYVPMFGKTIIENTPVLSTVAVIENVFDETCKIAIAQVENIVEKKPPPLREAFTYMPKILMDFCNVLVMGQIGKNFSGDGMDPDITSTFCTSYVSGGINAQGVRVLDLSSRTRENGIGPGYSNAVTKRMFSQPGLTPMYPDAIACIIPGGVRIPIVIESDKEVMQVYIRTCNGTDKESPGIVRILSSLHLEHIVLSKAYYGEVRNHPGTTIENEPEYLLLDEGGSLW